MEHMLQLLNNFIWLLCLAQRKNNRHLKLQNVRVIIKNSFNSTIVLSL